METFVIYSEIDTPARGYNWKLEQVVFSKEEAEKLTSKLDKRAKKRVFKYKKVKNSNS